MHNNPSSVPSLCNPSNVFFQVCLVSTPSIIPATERYFWIMFHPPLCFTVGSVCSERCALSVFCHAAFCKNAWTFITGLNQTEEPVFAFTLAKSHLATVNGTSSSVLFQQYLSFFILSTFQKGIAVTFASCAMSLQDCSCFRLFLHLNYTEKNARCDV